MDNTDTKGLVQIYTGDGKGKSTAALGLALRAAGQGLHVGFIQFLKGEVSGEHLFLEKYPAFEIIRLGKESHFKRGNPELAQEVQETLMLVEQKMNDYDLLVMDEVFIAVEMGLINTRQLLELINKKPEALEIVLTGRNAPREIIKRADLVTVMTMVKHPFQQGITARRGIEY